MLVLKFGTDGVRGVANLELTPELVLAVGRAAARVLGDGRFVVGRDTRRSGPLLEAALVSGLAAEGAEVTTLGVAPTPAVAWLAAADGMAGAMISASHNPFEDNGVKLFTAAGAKLTDAQESALEEEVHALLHHEDHRTPRTGGAVGTVVARPDEVQRWARSVAASVEGRRLDGLAVVVDCANGSAGVAAPALLARLGAEVTVLHDEPDGTNINAGCGSTHPDDLRRVVRDRGADLGVAFDGDADRVLAVDADGWLVDGDQIIAVLAVDRHARGALAQDAVVVTVMSNLGFRQGMAARGIGVREVPVGDRYVVEAMAAEGITLGGEQSGHIVFSDLATTGDGLLTAVQLLDVVVRRGERLGALAAAAMTRLPQVLHNVRVDRTGLDVGTALAEPIATVEAGLGDRGRVLVRSSGTEPLVRVMVEAPTLEEAEAAASTLVEAVAALSGS